MAVVFVPPPLPSKRAQELAAVVKEALERFLRENPGTSNVEMRQAFDLAFGALRKGPDPRAIAAVVGAGVVAAGLVVALASRQTGGNAPIYILMAIAGVAILATLVVVASKLR